MDNNDDVKYPIDVPNNHVQEDYELARETLRDLVHKATKALEGILEVAESTEHPRAFEVAAQLIKSVSDASKDLLELQKSKSTLSSDEEPSSSSGDTNIKNAVFVGSTRDLQDLLKKNFKVIEHNEQ